MATAVQTPAEIGTAAARAYYEAAQTGDAAKVAAASIALTEQIRATAPHINEATAAMRKALIVEHGVGIILAGRITTLIGRFTQQKG